MSETLTKILIFVVIFGQCVFLRIDPNEYIYPFLFPPLDEQGNITGIPTISYVWLMLEKLTIITIVYRWWKDTSRDSVAAFLILVVYDFVDWLIEANKPMFEFYGWPVTNNIVMLVSYFILTWSVDEWRKSKNQF